MNQFFHTFQFVISHYYIDIKKILSSVAYKPNLYTVYRQQIKKAIQTFPMDSAWHGNLKEYEVELLRAKEELPQVRTFKNYLKYIHRS